VFAIVDHCTGEAWVDTAARMDRWAATDLLREAILDRFGSVEAGAAAGLKLRHDGGRCFRSGPDQAEIDHLGIDRSPAFVYEPETNGVVEKFLQTLKEQILWIERFDTLEQLRARVRQSARDYNEHWRLERHGYRSPRQARAALIDPHAALA
jgi:putative transposase